MKHILSKLALVAALAMCVLTASAQKSYTHSIGVVLGTVDGASYKAFVTNDLAVQVDLVFQFVPTYGTMNFKGVSSYSSSLSTTNFALNPNVVYQKNLTSFDWGELAWYAGGGLSIGLVQNYYLAYDYNPGVLGKFGINAMAGLELELGIPMTIFFDFRPGYGLLFGDEKYKTENITVHNRYNGHVFDWGLGVGARYCF